MSEVSESAATSPNAHPGRLPDRPVLLYDDSCRFCRAMAELALRWDHRGRLAFLPWNHELAQDWMKDLNPEVRDASMHFKLRNGRVLSGASTFPALLVFLPGAGWLGRLGRRNRLVGRCLEGVYSVVARNREFLSKLVPYRQLVYREPQLR